MKVWDFFLLLSFLVRWELEGFGVIVGDDESLCVIVFVWRYFNVRVDVLLKENVWLRVYFYLDVGCFC